VREEGISSSIGLLIHPPDVDPEAIQLTLRTDLHGVTVRTTVYSMVYQIDSRTKREQSRETLRGHGASSPDFAANAVDDMRSPPAGGGTSSPPCLGRRPVKKSVFHAGTSVTLDIVVPVGYTRLSFFGEGGVGG
jgi:hypothetical protein